MHKDSYHLTVIAILAVFFVAATVAAVYFYLQYRHDEEVLADPQKIASEESRRVIEKVGRLMVLPDETPQIGTVSNVEQLRKEQPFFTKAENGDKVLMYTNSKQAILYRPSKNIVVNVAPLTVGATPSASPAEQASPSARRLPDTTGAPRPLTP